MKVVFCPPYSFMGPTPNNPHEVHYFRWCASEYDDYPFHKKKKQKMFDHRTYSSICLICILYYSINNGYGISNFEKKKIKNLWSCGWVQTSKTTLMV